MKITVNQSILLAIGLQLAIVLGVYINAVAPYWFGERIQVSTVPIDPRSLFRGNYARLGYDFSRIDFDHFESSSTVRKGDRFFVSLEKNSNEIYEFSSISKTVPDSEIYLVGHVQRLHFKNGKPSEAFMRYGIEAFFAPKDEALALERELADGAIATIAIHTNGQARIVSVD